jgi:riboflavin kinase / FMN adenylyltransferase
MSYQVLHPHVLHKDMIAIIGFFDGVHLAHQALLNQALTWAKKTHKKPVVITFDVHPRSVIFGLEKSYITPLQNKVKRLLAAGFEDVYVIEFNLEKAKIKAEDFIKDYLSDLYGLVCGFDFRFGHGGQGDVALLKSQTAFETRVLEEVRHQDQKISSSVIQDLIAEGKCEEVTEVLGRYYSIEGEVIHGEKKGRLIGYPTANIDTDGFIIPKTGVYATYTKVKEEIFASMTSVGHNPTLNDHHPLSVESYLFDFDETIYGEIIETYFVSRLRGEMKFNEVQELIRQIDADGVNTLKILKTHQKPLS